MTRSLRPAVPLAVLAILWAVPACHREGSLRAPLPYKMHFE